MPKRIQRKRTKGWRMPEDAVYVGRPTRWGNPYIVTRRNGAWMIQDARPIGRKPVWLSTRWETKKQAAEHALELFKKYLDVTKRNFPGVYFRLIDDLRGKDLACWCPLDQPCHADILLELANRNGRQRSDDEMNEVWHKITDDPATLPPLDVPVFAAGGSLTEPMTLIRCDDYDENGDPCWAWCNPFKVWWAGGKWEAIDPEWDDDYQPGYWHPYPKPPQ